MNIPNLPTDNLYKFLAIFGIVLVIFSHYIYIKETEDIIFKSNKLNLDSDKLSYKTKSLLEKTEELKNEIVDVNIKETKVKEELLYLLNQSEILRESFLDIKNQDDLLQYSIDRARADERLYYFFSIAGYFFVILGFSCWYFKLQRYQDEIVKKQAQNKK